MHRKLMKLWSVVAHFRMPACNRKQKAGNRSAGFTLTEIVVASGLLIIGVVPILKALTSAQVTSVIIERKTRSLILAQAKLDEIKAKSVYDYTNGGESFSESGTDLGGSYRCNVADNTGDPLKQISVSVGYDLNGNESLSSGEIEVTLTTYLARRWPSS